MAWVPLESNPDVMTKFLHELGVPNKWGLVDVYGLDPDLLAMLPKPVLSIILLYPINSKTEDPKSNSEAKDKDSTADSSKVYHLAQYVSNACGTIALIHSVANNLDQIELKDGVLKKFLDETKDLTSAQRGEKLVEAQGISSTHEDFAKEGQTEAPGEDEKVIHHFVAFVQKEGSIYELDGRKPGPINHGPSSKETFLNDAAKVCQEYMSRDPEEVRFTLMAMAAVE